MWRARFGRGFGPVVRQTTWMNEGIRDKEVDRIWNSVPVRTQIAFIPKCSAINSQLQVTNMTFWRNVFPLSFRVQGEFMDLRPLMTVSDHLANKAVLCSRTLESFMTLLFYYFNLCTMPTFTMCITNKQMHTWLTVYYTVLYLLLLYDALALRHVKCTFVQALRLCTGRTAHRGSRGIALLFHDQRH